VVIKPAMVVELWEKLLVRKRKLDVQENVILAREHGMVEAKRALRRVRMECDVVHDWARAIQHDYQARMCASTTLYVGSLTES
jgi:rhamnose utilization protein RhaD (predicted bifunctional aldolase and dehydrogenase)